MGKPGCEISPFSPSFSLSLSLSPFTNSLPKYSEEKLQCRRQLGWVTPSLGLSVICGSKAKHFNEMQILKDNGVLSRLISATTGQSPRLCPVVRVRSSKTDGSIPRRGHRPSLLPFKEEEEKEKRSPSRSRSDWLRSCCCRSEVRARKQWGAGGG